MRIIAGKYRSRILKSLKGEALRPTSDRLRVTLFDVLGGAVAGSRFLDVFAGTGAVGIEALSRGAAEAIFIEHHTPAAKLIRRNLDSLGITSGATVLTADALAGLEKLATSALLARASYGETARLRTESHAGEEKMTSSLLGLKPSGSVPVAWGLKPPPPEDSRSIESSLAAPALEKPYGQPFAFMDFVFVDPPYAAHEDYARALQFLGSNAATFLSPGALIIFEHHHKFVLPEKSGRLTRTRVLKQGDAALSFYRLSAAPERFT